MKHWVLTLNYFPVRDGRYIEKKKVIHNHPKVFFTICCSCYAITKNDIFVWPICIVTHCSIFWNSIICCVSHLLNSSNSFFKIFVVVSQELGSRDYSGSHHAHSYFIPSLLPLNYNYLLSYGDNTAFSSANIFKTLIQSSMTVSTFWNLLWTFLMFST